MQNAQKGNYQVEFLSMFCPVQLQSLWVSCYSCATLLWAAWYGDMWFEGEGDSRLLLEEIYYWKSGITTWAREFAAPSEAADGEGKNAWQRKRPDDERLMTTSVNLLKHMTTSGVLLRVSSCLVCIWRAVVWQQGFKRCQPYGGKHWARAGT